MSNQEKYQHAFAAMKDASAVLKSIGSLELYYESLLELVRYGSLAGQREETMTYACEAIDRDPKNVIIFLNDEDFKNSWEDIKQELRKRIDTNKNTCNDILKKIDNLYLTRRHTSYFTEKIQEIGNLLTNDTFFDSLEALEITKELEVYAGENRLITKEKHIENQRQKRLKKEKEAEKERALEAQRIKDEEAQSIKEMNDRKVALEKAAKEKREREKKQKENKERQIRLEKQDEEEKLRSLRRAREQRAAEKRKRLNIGIVILIIVVILIISANSLILNRTRYYSLDANTFHERLSQPNDTFTSYFFVFNDMEILQVRALPGRKIKVPDNSKSNKEYIVDTWSTEVSNSDIFPFETMPSSTFFTYDNVQTTLPGEKIQVGLIDRVYFAHTVPVLYHIRFDGNGVKGLEREVEVPYSSHYKIPYPTGPVPENLEFLGWSLEKAGDPKTAYSPGDLLVVPTQDLNLYALWKFSDYSIIHVILIVITILGLGLINLIIVITRNILLVRLILLVSGLLLMLITGILFRKGKKISGILYLFFSLTILFWGCVPNLYLMMAIVSL